MPEVTIEEAGYVYIYFSNENETFVEVYFDDFSVTHTPTNIVQYNEYYPFGLQTGNSWSREEVMPNAFLYNGGSELNSVTNNYEMFFREYDPTLGRMNAIDPMASKYASLTPYNYAFNDPVTLNDPSGADPAYQRADDTWWTAPRFNRGRFSGFDNARDFAFANQAFYPGNGGFSSRDGAFGRMGVGTWSGPSYGDILNRGAAQSIADNLGLELNGNYRDGWYIKQAAGVSDTWLGENGINYYYKYYEKVMISPFEQMQGWLTMEQVAVAIRTGGIRRFIEFVQDPDYGTGFFLEDIEQTQTANSENNGIPGPIRFGIKAASWGHKYFANDELRHIIASFLITEKYDPSIAVAITSSNEYLGFIQNDIPDLINGIDNGWAFQVSDFAHNKQGMVLWQYYDWWRNGYIDKIFKDK